MRAFGLLKRGDALVVLEIVLELAVGLGLGALAGLEIALLENGLAHSLAQLLLFDEAFDQDVLRAFDRLGGVRNVLGLVAEGERPDLKGLTGLRLFGAVTAVPDPVGQRL